VTDPYRISEAPQASAGSSQPNPRNGIVRPVLWLLLVISLAGNMVMSSTGMNMLTGAAFGVATVSCAIALIVHHYRNRRR
jgi:hypothetical protein